MKPRTATFTISNEFTPSMDAVRQTGFPIKGEAKSLKDEFDEKGQSVHLCLYLDGKIAVNHRFTDNLAGRRLVMEKWTEGKAPVPKSDPCMEMGRFVIAPEFRGLDGLFESFVLIGLIYASKANYTNVATMIKDERSLVTRCKALGFEPQELLTECKVPNSGTIKARTLIYDLRGKRDELDRKFSETSRVLHEKYNITLNTEFLNDVTPVVPLTSKASITKTHFLSQTQPSVPSESRPPIPRSKL